MRIRKSVRAGVVVGGLSLGLALGAASMVSADRGKPDTVAAEIPVLEPEKLEAANEEQTPSDSERAE